MTQIEKIFSLWVFGDTFPKPTLVKLLNVKYRAVMYLSFVDGPPVLDASIPFSRYVLLYGQLSCVAKVSSQPKSKTKNKNLEHPRQFWN